MTKQTATALPSVVDYDTWRAELDDLRRREKAATRELDAIAAQRRRLPMVEMPHYTLIGKDGPVTLADIFGYHALQLGLSEVQGLRANRMPHRWLAIEAPPSVAPIEGWDEPLL